MTPRRRRARTPQVRLADLLGRHLQVVQHVAFVDAHAPEQHEHRMVGTGLLPPELLPVVHERLRGRAPPISWLPSRVQLSGRGSVPSRTSFHCPGVTSNTISLCSLGVPESTPKSMGSGPAVPVMA